MLLTFRERKEDNVEYGWCFIRRINRRGEMKLILAIELNLGEYVPVVQEETLFVSVGDRDVSCVLIASEDHIR